MALTLRALGSPLSTVLCFRQLERGRGRIIEKDLSCYRDLGRMEFLLFLIFKDSDFPLLKRLASPILNGGSGEE